MTESKPAWTDQRIEQIVGNLLRAGVILAAAVVLGGGILYLIHHGKEPIDVSAASRAAAGPLQSGRHRGRRREHGGPWLDPIGPAAADRHAGRPRGLLGVRLLVRARLHLRGRDPARAGDSALRPVRRLALKVCPPPYNTVATGTTGRIGTNLSSRGSLSCPPSSIWLPEICRAALRPIPHCRNRRPRTAPARRLFASRHPCGRAGQSGGR